MSDWRQLEGPTLSAFTQVVTRPIRFVDLCAGLGGFHRALSGVSDTHDSEGAQLQFHCVFASELDPELRTLYLENFPDIGETYRTLFPAEDTRALLAGIDDSAVADALDIYSDEGQLDAIHGDLSAFVDPESGGLRRGATGDPLIPEHELLCAGFPCQPFSKSGGQLGFADTRGTIFHLIATVLEERRPPLVLLENVGNFERHDDGNTWTRIQQVLNDFGYVVSATLHRSSNRSGASGLLSPHDLGLPHHRQRFFIVAQLKDTPWLSPLAGRSPFPAGLARVGAHRESAEKAAAKALREIVEDNWRGARESDIGDAQISPDRVTAIEHWNALLRLLRECDAEEQSASWRVSMPSFPIWGYELDPWQWYPIDKNPAQWISDPVRLAKERANILDRAAEDIHTTTEGAVDLLSWPPTGVRGYLANRVLSPGGTQEWINTWPGYASKRDRWPNWKIRFLEQNRQWAVRLWANLSSERLRSWLDLLVSTVPASSHQKLEWNCKGEVLDLWQHVLQFRPSGLRAKRLRHVPALVAMTSTQIPIVPRLDADEPTHSGDPRTQARHLLRTEALQLQGFPASWRHPSSRDVAFRAFGNAVHCELVVAIIRSWLGEGADVANRTEQLELETT